MTLRTFAIVLNLAFVSPAFAAEPIDLLTGISTYDVTLDSSTNAPGASASGQMTDRSEIKCGAYESQTDMQVEFSGNGISFRMVVENRYVETDNKLDFEVRSSIGGKDLENAKGVATRTADGISVDFARPAGLTKSLKGPVVFPVQSARKVIEAARNGSAFLDLKAFDGSSEGAVLDTTVTIGPAKTTPEEGEEAEFASALGFATMRRWPVRYSYFSPGPGDRTPIGVADFIVYENGALLSSTIKFGPMTLRMQLTGFKPLPIEKCNQ